MHPQKNPDTYPNVDSSSPLEIFSEREIHLSLFNEEVKKSLNRIGELSADLILKNIHNNNIVKINDVGQISGAGRIDNTQDLIIEFIDNTILNK